MALCFFKLSSLNFLWLAGEDSQWGKLENYHFVSGLKKFSSRYLLYYICTFALAEEINCNFQLNSASYLWGQYIKKLTSFVKAGFKLQVKVGKHHFAWKFSFKLLTWEFFMEKGIQLRSSFIGLVIFKRILLIRFIKMNFNHLAAMSDSVHKVPACF